MRIVGQRRMPNIIRPNRRATFARWDSNKPGGHGKDGRQDDRAPATLASSTASFRSTPLEKRPVTTSSAANPSRMPTVMSLAVSKSTEVVRCSPGEPRGFGGQEARRCRAGARCRYWPRGGHIVFPSRGLGRWNSKPSNSEHCRRSSPCAPLGGFDGGVLHPDEQAVGFGIEVEDPSGR